MPTIFHHLNTVAGFLRMFERRTLWESLLYHGHYHHWQRRYHQAHRETAETGAPGALRDWQWLGRGLAAAGRFGIDLRCEHGVLRVEFLAEGLARVRLSRDATFPPIHSYAVLPEWWEPEAGPVVDLAAAGAGAALRFESSGLGLTVMSDPCRLAFHDREGRPLLADAAGAGWTGPAVTCSHRHSPGHRLYGLGQKASGLDHSGKRFTLWNRDPSGYAPGDDPLYQSIPLVVSCRNGSVYGVLYDNTCRADFDLGHGDPDVVSYRAAGGELCYYLLAGPSLASVVRSYVDLTGHMALPPRWALGYHQSRWSYASEHEVRQVAAELRTRCIPCDAIHLDIDHTRGYRVFTWDKARFPDPAGLIAELRAAGFRTVTIQDPGIKVDPAWDLCANGLAHDAFCRLPDGSLFSGPVWPGACYFPDFTNADVRAWWGEQYRGLLDAGVAGFWNDMNEPAVFFGLTFPEAVQHRADTGQTDHAAIHNVYGQCMAQAGHDALRRLQHDERPLLVSRAAYAGIQRYACTWTGDNESTWENLRVSIPMVLNLGLSGQALVGPDVGGFSGDCTPELLVRWTQLGAFLPWFRNHSALGTVHQEPWAFGEPYETICRRYIELRYRLMPYIYTAFWQAAETGLPVARPLILAFPYDVEALSIDDEYMFGDALLVAPVMAAAATGRVVYLPTGAWYDFWTGERFSGPGRYRVSASLEAMPLYVRAGSVVPLAPLMQYTGEFVPERLELHIYPGAGESLLYEDDGHSYAYSQGDRRLTRFMLGPTPTGLALERATEGRYTGARSAYDLVLWGRPCSLTGLMAESAQLPHLAASADGRVLTFDSSQPGAPIRFSLDDFHHTEVRW